jgi:nitrate/nitrite transporter NarK
MIRRIIIAVIAGFVTFSIWLEINSLDPITATGHLATARTAVLIILIPIITSLGQRICSNHAIPTSSRRAIGSTTIRLIDVPIITQLIQLDDTVSALSRYTGYTSIGRVLIAIVTAFIRPQNPIAAAMKLAIV